MKKISVNIAIVISQFNPAITKGLLACCLEELMRHGIDKEHIHLVPVPGAYEIPFAAHTLARQKKYSAIIGLGCIIKGETSHDVHIANWVSLGLGMVSIINHTPVLFGVLTPNNERQALKRSQPGPTNRGREVAEAALRMIEFTRRRR